MLRSNHASYVNHQLVRNQPLHFSSFNFACEKPNKDKLILHSCFRLEDDFMPHGIVEKQLLFQVSNQTKSYCYFILSTKYELETYLPKILSLLTHALTGKATNTNYMGRGWPDHQLQARICKHFLNLDIWSISCSRSQLRHKWDCSFFVTISRINQRRHMTLILFLLELQKRK